MGWCTLRQGFPALMEYRFALFFLFLYYIRPQDWMAGWAGVNVIKPLMLVWTTALFVRRTPSALPGLLRTPHDWVMLAYYVYVVWTAPDSRAALMGFLPLVVFYALTVQSLNTWERVAGYLKMWNWMLLTVAAIAVASLYGLDLTGARDVTSRNAGRLAIGTWLHNNPNSLAHTIVVALPLSYLAWFWRGGAAGRLVLFPASAALIWSCAYHTSSRGAYLVAGGLVVLLFFIGRPFMVKMIALATAGTVGISALSYLPRMSDMSNLGNDEGVMGRLMAWEMARTTLDSHATGLGWKQFVAWISWEGETFSKSTHSSYVQIGADLGLYGLFLFVAGLWVAHRSLALRAPHYTGSDRDREFSRRAALVLVVAYAVSNWMINREYHTEYFLLIAVAAAIHRLGASETTAPQESEVKTQSRWSFPDWRDGMASALLTWTVLYIWDYVLVNL